ncbi:AraC family transcriptional regulator [Rhizobium sp. BG4]|uniref:AraC family transcriptional regulator n=1 Tax=Rhizobium sp. BG4 TaxID=2613770 RepID=UPI00193DBAC2|nr:AraC family transcriptional regulator [Rhizobium sp. BG4]QRM44568.1 AraC family transcriptional regulator [Rhizobium sp. BG4]
MDPFSDLIGLLRPHAAVSKPITGCGAWGARYNAYDAPGFAIVLEGCCFLQFEDSEPVRLSAGDFILIPSTPAFALFSDPRAERIPREPTDQPVRHGEAEGEPDFRMLGGGFRIEPVNAALLLALLPGIIHIRANEGEADRLKRIVALIIEESVEDRPGREPVVERLLEVMLVEALRWGGMNGETMPSGMLRSMRDPSLARALRAMHADVRERWTVEGLAKLAGMSRSAFAARFAEALGATPIDYLAQWRMALARDALSRGDISLDRLAGDIGYDSASAFSTAFRRHNGCSPREFGRSAGR